MNMLKQTGYCSASLGNLMEFSRDQHRHVPGLDMNVQCVISQQRLKAEHNFEVYPCGSPKVIDGKIRKNDMKER
jgi:hypothetical protein